MQMHRLYGIAAMVVSVMTSCTPEQVWWQETHAPMVDGAVTLLQVSFDALPGWKEDVFDTAIPAIERSCKAMSKKTGDVVIGGRHIPYAHWHAACATLPYQTSDIRVWLKTHFSPYQLQWKERQKGLFTGYYEPLLYGSYEKTERFSVPLYTFPGEWMTINLSKFDDSLPNKTLVVKRQGRHAVPVESRSDIDKGSLGTDDVLLYVDDPVAAFFLHIQGSGQVELPDGTRIRIGYDGKNGHDYTAIGKILIERGAIAKEDMSAEAIVQWLHAHPERAQAVMQHNASYVFFKRIDGEGPIGAQGVALTAERSLAVDREHIPFGMLMWLDTHLPDQRVMQQLMVAQDTGSAIKGGIRGDIFFGAGGAAYNNASQMQHQGMWWVLLPI